MFVFPLSNIHSNLINMLCKLLTYLDSDLARLIYVLKQQDRSASYRAYLWGYNEHFSVEKTNMTIVWIKPRPLTRTYCMYIIGRFVWTLSNIHSNNVNKIKYKSTMLCNLLAKYAAVNTKQSKLEILQKLLQQTDPWGLSGSQPDQV